MAFTHYVRDAARDDDQENLQPDFDYFEFGSRSMATRKTMASTMIKLPKRTNGLGISENKTYPMGMLMQSRVYSKGVTKLAGAYLRALI